MELKENWDTSCVVYLICEEWVMFALHKLIMTLKRFLEIRDWLQIKEVSIFSFSWLGAKSTILLILLYIILYCTI